VAGPGSESDVQRVEIGKWIDRISNLFFFIVLDTRICREGAKLMAGKSEDLFEDAILAATARIHRLTVATRNLRT
jgi:toxin FitB